MKKEAQEEKEQVLKYYRKTSWSVFVKMCRKQKKCIKKLKK
jgi:hypothetical protein